MAMLSAGVIFVAALASSTLAFAAGPSSTNYAIPSSTVNAGVGPMTSSGYKLAASVGDAFFGGTSMSTNYSATPGFWPTIKGVGPGCILDLDGNGNIDALTDGLMLIRVLFGLTGTAVTNGAIGPNPTRTTYAAIQPIINLPLLDVDQNGATDALTDGLIVLRAMFGLTGAAVLNNAVGSNANRGTWPVIRAYLNATCGTAFGA